MRVLLAGATGAIGRRLVPLLLGAGHDVTGTTRSPAQRPGARARRGAPAVLDCFRRRRRCERRFVPREPEVVIHQLTDLPREFDEATSGRRPMPRNARIRTEGTRNLIAAAQAAGARRLIVQSIAFAYAPGGEPHPETDPLNLADPARAVTVKGAADMEQQVLGAPASKVSCCAMACSTARHLVRRRRHASRPCMSMPPRRRRCWRSPAARPASTISPTMTASCPIAKARARARVRSAVSAAAMQRSGHAASFAKARRLCGHGVTFCVNEPLTHVAYLQHELKH